LLRLDELTETFHRQARGGDLEAGHLMVRLEAERRALLGLIGSNYDPVQLVANKAVDREKSTAAIERSLARLGKWPPSATNGHSDSGSPEAEK
jgi:hypothetical protein